MPFSTRRRSGRGTLATVAARGCCDRARACLGTQTIASRDTSGSDPGCARDLRGGPRRRSPVNRQEFLLAAAGAPFAPAALARNLAAAPPLVLVTADTESHVAALSAATSRVLHRLPTAPGP